MDYSAYFKNARKATQVMVALTEDQINAVLLELADAVVLKSAHILAENEKDLERMPQSDPKYDRLKLTESRILDIATDMRNVVKLPSPLHEKLLERTLPNGLQLTKVRVPLGVVSVIYEARPNVTLDVFSLCFKTGNVCLLKGGSDAVYSNTAILAIIHDVLEAQDIDPRVVSLLPVEREATEALLQAVGYVDVLIPRGSQQLIHYVRDHSKIPVIETGAGIVHTYFDLSGDLTKAKDIVFNAKTRKVSACNALDTLLLHQDRLADLAVLAAPLADSQVEIFADEASYPFLEGHYPETLLQHAGAESFGTEFLDYKLSIKTVSGLEESLQHIAQYSSGHSEAIITEDPINIQRFLNQVDAAAVYVNASPAFTDGAQFGLGAEIGISTQKLHARGPMGLEELTSYKWLVIGDGQVRC
ncbi:glutamate-5-semialdehyde dehydrogenase [bacterium A37T11]|nr:glutamate-5-semialdehyde dehydrogenase [bacterium A37T11]